MFENHLHKYLEKGWSYNQTQTHHIFLPPDGKKKVIYSKDSPMIRLGIHQKEENAYAHLGASQESLS